MNEEIVNCFNIVIEVVKGVALYVMPIAAFIAQEIYLERIIKYVLKEVEHLLMKGVSYFLFLFTNSFLDI